MNARRRAPVLTDDGRAAVVSAAVAAGVTVVGLFIVAVLLGGVAAMGSLTALRALAVPLTGLPAGAGAFLGSRRAAGLLELGTLPAAIGFVGATIVTVVLAGLGLVVDGPTSVYYALVTPLFGASVGAWLGGIRMRGSTRSTNR